MRRQARYALYAEARVRGRPLAEARVTSGQAMVVGPEGTLVTPTPDGTPWLARASWIDRRRVVVEDGRGQEHALEVGQRFRLAVGDVELVLMLVPERQLRRLAPVAWSASLSWFTIVVASTLFVAQLDVLVRNRCEWFGIDCPTPQVAGPSWNAEYLARLLRDDLEGEERGVVVQRAPEDGVELPSAYMPAGDRGPTERGPGADRVAPEPVRQVADAESRQREAARDRPSVDEARRVEHGTPIPEPDPLVQDGGEESAGLEDQGQDALDVPQERAEEERGWGVRDWMDATPERRAEIEREVMKELARERLRIDPEDPAALSLLAYYQYLSEDYGEAVDTYDRLLAVNPESPATYNNKALVYKRQGKYQEEEGLYRVALSLDPDDATALNNLAVNLAHQGRYDEALAIMDRLETLLPDDPYSDLHRAKIHASRGDDDEALRMLERALQRMDRLNTLHHIEFRQDIRVDPSFDKLRQDARFRAILSEYYGENSPLGGPP